MNFASGQVQSTWEAIKELPDWNVEERERGMIDLKRRFLYLSYFLGFLLTITSQQMMCAGDRSHLGFCYINHFTANTGGLRASYQIRHGVATKLKGGPETFWGPDWAPVQLA